MASYTQYAAGNTRLDDDVFVVYVVDSLRLVPPFIQARVLSGTEIIRNADAMLRKHDDDGAVVVTH